MSREELIKLFNYIKDDESNLNKNHHKVKYKGKKN